MDVVGWDIPVGLPTVDGLTRFDGERYSIVNIIRHIAGDADVGEDHRTGQGPRHEAWHDV